MPLSDDGAHLGRSRGEEQEESEGAHRFESALEM